MHGRAFSHTYSIFAYDPHASILVAASSSLTRSLPYEVLYVGAIKKME